MITKLFTISTTNTIPYQNLALEELLLHEVEKDECILYLWQNRNTVVIGHNQNCYAECRAQALLQDAGYVVRRLSGGGAVFHDLGNLNFTFLARQANYDVARQMEVILRAVQSFGIAAVKSGRNDVTVNDAKFSGNAFYRTGDRCYHHGTLLLHADTGLLSRYLTVKADKLNAHGVRSVRSRVVNLCDIASGITVENMRDALISAFSQVYGFPVEVLDKTRINPTQLQTLTEKFSADEWIFGHEANASYVLRRRFSWGEAELRLFVSQGVIASAVLYTDAMEPLLASVLCDILANSIFSAAAVAAALEKEINKTEISELAGMLRDIAAWMEDWFQNGTI